MNEQLRKEKVTEKAKKLHSLQDSVRPSDAFLFPRNLTRFINKSTAAQIGNWITTSRRAIRNSVSKWKEHKASGVQTVVGWLSINNPSNTKFFEALRSSQRKRMNERLNNGRQKERRRRLRLATHPSSQQSMNGYVTLTRSA